MVIHTAHALVADTDKYAGEMAEGEEDDEGSSDESGEESGHSLGTQLSLERFTAVARGGGMTSDCTVVDSSDGGCGLPTPPSSPPAPSVASTSFRSSSGAALCIVIFELDCIS